MVSQHQLTAPILDIAKQPIGQGQGVATMRPIRHIYIMAPIGPVLLIVTTPTGRGLLGTMVSSVTATSATGSLAYAPPFQSRLRSSQSDNPKINHRLQSIFVGGGEDKYETKAK